MADRHSIHIDRPIVQADLDFLDGRADLIGHDDATLGNAPAAVIGIGDHWDAERFAQFPNLRVISRAGIGYDNVDVDAATAAGVIVCNGPDSPTVSTAEHTLALMFAVTKELPAKIKRAADGLSGPGSATSLEFDGAMLGLVGLGRIAKRVAVAAQAFGMQVIACDPFLETSPIPGVTLAPFHQVISSAHVLSLHAPSTAETRHMMNATSFAAMRPGSYLINCARGPLVDHDALLVNTPRWSPRGSGARRHRSRALAGRAPAARPRRCGGDTPHRIVDSNRTTSVVRTRLRECALAVLDGRPASIVNPF